MENGYDELNYSRSFSNPSMTKIVNSEENDKIIETSFNMVWEHKIKLTVKDKFWKLSEIEKTIDIKSILRPEIFITPKATSRWNAVNFVVQSNEDIINYNRDFWDGETISTQTNKISHTYRKVWTYKVILTVYWENWMENILIDTVFIWDKNSPIGSYIILWSNQDILRQNEECVEMVHWTTTTNPAYKIERYQNFTIDPKASVNIKWEPNNLNFYFQPKNAEIFKNNNFKHSFDELWCQFIDLTVEDISV